MRRDIRLFSSTATRGMASLLSSCTFSKRTWAGATCQGLDGHGGHRRSLFTSSGRCERRAARPDTAEFIPLSFWYDEPPTSRESDRRHDLWLVYGLPSYSPAR